MTFLPTRSSKPSIVALLTTTLASLIWISIFLSFLLIDLYPILGSSHPFLMYLLNSTEKEKSLQEQALK